MYGPNSIFDISAIIRMEFDSYLFIRHKILSHKIVRDNKNTFTHIEIKIIKAIDKEKENDFY